MATIEKQVLHTIKQHPMKSQQELADILGMSRIALAGHISRLTKKGEILGKGYVFPVSSQWLVVGGCNMDYLAVAQHDLIEAESYPGTVSEMPGGVARNIAENMSRLGLSCQLVTALGDDSAGEYLIQHCHQIGIETDFILVQKTQNTSKYLSIQSNSGQLIHAIADMAIMYQLDSHIGSLSAQFKQAKGIIIDCNLSQNAIELICQNQSQTPIFADAVSPAKVTKLSKVLTNIHCLKLNYAEAKALTGQNGTAIELAKELNQRGVKQVLLSLGTEGILYCDCNSNIKLDALPIPAGASTISDVGVGDALLAGFVFAESLEKPLTDKLNIALACAAITLSHPGANCPELSLDKIEEYLCQI